MPLPAASSLTERLRSPWVLAASLLFLITNFVLVALPWYWNRPGPDLRPALVGPAVHMEGWPPVETVFIVTGPAAPRLVRLDSGSFDDWELPLASRNHAILDVRVTGSLDVHGIWSPLWVSHGRAWSVTNMSTGEPASPELRSLAARVYGDDLASRGVHPRWVAVLTGEGAVNTVRMAWAGIANEALVLLGLIGVVLSAGSIADARSARRARLLSKGICPWCRYTVGEMDRCPECGRILRSAAPAHPHAHGP